MASTATAAIPTGTVTFKDKNKTLGTATLNAAGQATFTTSTLSNGSHPITVTYGGSSGFLTSTSATLTQTVSP
ncbi:MAG TPA: Ig-like domain-containing protein [Thermoanaerobaculia bacterium]